MSVHLGRHAAGEPPAADVVPASLLSRSVNGLHAAMPAMSAKTVLSRGQACSLLVAAVVTCLGAAAWLVGALIGLIAVATAAYLLIFLYNVVLFRTTLRGARIVHIPDEVASSVPDASLPRYTVLIAAYQEAGVIAETLRAMAALDYPRDRLEIKLLLEEDDLATIAAAQAARPGKEVDIVRVPTSLPRTKPKALNYGLGLSTGALVTVYDAEDRPEPLQLRRAAVAFRRGDPSMACLQARLYFYNDQQNLLTRWFAAEYNLWFAESLPALARLRAPIPLGGTSMHVRRDVLERVGAWDPHNVTEDADLGVRLHRMGFTTEVLDSETLEEANCDLINWVRQRSRWYKGYLQTWLVHMRSPVRLWRDTGGAGVAGLAAVVGGTPLLALINPFFWLLTCLWVLGGTYVQALFPAWLYYLAMLSLLFGNLLALYRTAVALRTSGHPELLGAVLLWPLYWIVMSAAALRAVGQLAIAPWFWEKTVHGLDAKREPLGD